jgi:hypothetical protein
MVLWVRQSQSRGTNERKSILEATAELTFTAAFDRGKGLDIGTADWEDVDIENMEGSAQSRTYERHNKICSFGPTSGETHKKAETCTCLIR